MSRRRCCANVLNDRSMFWDESGFRADVVQGTTWGVKGRTPIIAVPGTRQSVSAASAVNAKGAFWFATYQGAMAAAVPVAADERPGVSRRAHTQPTRGS
jgi:DDE superfamily endonuclease